MLASTVSMSFAAEPWTQAACSSPYPGTINIPGCGWWAGGYYIFGSQAIDTSTYDWQISATGSPSSRKDNTYPGDIQVVDARNGGMIYRNQASNSSYSVYASWDGPGWMGLVNATQYKNAALLPSGGATVYRRIKNRVPVLAITSNMNPTPILNSVSVSGTFTDQDVNDADAVYWVCRDGSQSGTLQAAVNTVGSAQSFSGTIPTGTMPSGDIVVDVYAYDNSGASSAKSTIVINKQIPKPTLNDSTTNNMVRTNKATFNNINLIGSASTAAGATNLAAQYRVDGGAWTTFATASTASSINYNYQLDVGAYTEGSHTLDIQVADTMNNVVSSTMSSRAFTIVKSAPTISLIYSTTNWTNQNVNVSATATGGGLLNTASYSFAQNGTFQFTATDPYGFGYSSSVTATVNNIDKINPIMLPATGTKISSPCEDPKHIVGKVKIQDGDSKLLKTSIRSTPSLVQRDVDQATFDALDTNVSAADGLYLVPTTDGYDCKIVQSFATAQELVPYSVIAQDNAGNSVVATYNVEGLVKPTGAVSSYPFVVLGLGQTQNIDIDFTPTPKGSSPNCSGASANTTVMTIDSSAGTLNTATKTTTYKLTGKAVGNTNFVATSLLDSSIKILIPVQVVDTSKISTSSTGNFIQENGDNLLLVAKEKKYDLSFSGCATGTSNGKFLAYLDGNEEINSPVQGSNGIVYINDRLQFQDLGISQHTLRLVVYDAGIIDNAHKVYDKTLTIDVLPGYTSIVKPAFKKTGATALQGATSVDAAVQAQITALNTKYGVTIDQPVYVQSTFDSTPLTGSTKLSTTPISLDTSVNKYLHYGLFNTHSSIKYTIDTVNTGLVPSFTNILPEMTVGSDFKAGVKVTQGSIMYLFPGSAIDWNSYERSGIQTDLLAVNLTEAGANGVALKAQYNTAVTQADFAALYSAAVPYATKTATAKTLATYNWNPTLDSSGDYLFIVKATDYSSSYKATISKVTIVTPAGTKPNGEFFASSVLHFVTQDGRIKDMATGFSTILRTSVSDGTAVKFFDAFDVSKQYALIAGAFSTSTDALQIFDSELQEIKSFALADLGISTITGVSSDSGTAFVSSASNLKMVNLTSFAVTDTGITGATCLASYPGAVIVGGADDKLITIYASSGGTLTKLKSITATELFGTSATAKKITTSPAETGYKIYVSTSQGLVVLGN